MRAAGSSSGGGAAAGQVAAATSSSRRRRRCGWMMRGRGMVGELSLDSSTSSLLPPAPHPSIPPPVIPSPTPPSGPPPLVLLSPEAWTPPTSATCVATMRSAAAWSRRARPTRPAGGVGYDLSQSVPYHPSRGPPLHPTTPLYPALPALPPPPSPSSLPPAFRPPQGAGEAVAEGPHHQ